MLIVALILMQVVIAVLLEGMSGVYFRARTNFLLHTPVARLVTNQVYDSVLFLCAPTSRVFKGLGCGEQKPGERGRGMSLFAATQSV